METHKLNILMTLFCLVLLNNYIISVETFEANPIREAKEYLFTSTNQFASRIRFIQNREALDVNIDGRVDFTDGIIIGRTQAYLTQDEIDPYDITHDGKINRQDHFKIGHLQSYDKILDVNRDGYVDFIDGIIIGRSKNMNDLD